MAYIIQPNTLAGLDAIREDTQNRLHWSSPFILPAWMSVWWDSFGAGNEMFIQTVKEGSTIIGVAPLMKKGDTVSFIGNVDVCDYQDFIVEPGKEQDFFKVLLDYLKAEGISNLNLAHVRPDSLVATELSLIAEASGYQISKQQEDVSFEMNLPAGFDIYLDSLNTKQRHEVRRKLRRISEEGNIKFHFEEKGDSLKADLETFFRMFIESRQDKAAFLTDKMKQFFRNIVNTMSEEGLLRLGIFELDDKQIAEILCFEFNNCLYLYNSGYDPKYVSLSAGLLSKVMAIKDCIERGIGIFDFLKGAEPYKAHIGGKEVPLFRYRIIIK